jgi:hypothetical protein
MRDGPTSNFHIERAVMARLAAILNIPFAILWLTVGIAWIAGLLKPFSLLTWMGFGVALIGWIIMVVAKWPEIKKGNLTKFGSKGLPPENVRLYRMSYFALFVAVLFLIAPHFTDALDMEMIFNNPMDAIAR